MHVKGNGGQVKLQMIIDWYLAIDIIQTPINGFNSRVIVKKCIYICNPWILIADCLYITLWFRLN